MLLLCWLLVLHWLRIRSCVSHRNWLLVLHRLLIWIGVLRLSGLGVLRRLLVWIAVLRLRWLGVLRLSRAACEPTVPSTSTCSSVGISL